VATSCSAQDVYHQWPLASAKGGGKVMIQAILSAETAALREGTAEYRLAPNVVLLLVHDGTARLLDLEGNFYALSATGAVMLYEILMSDSAAAVRKIATEYDVAAQHVQNDVHVFLAKLIAKQLIYRSGLSPHADAGRAMVPPLLLTPMLYAIEAWTRSVKARAGALLTLAYLAIRLFGWPRTLETWRHYCQRKALYTAACEMEATARAIDDTVRAVAARQPLNIACKERALCCWFLLRAAGLPAQIVLGVELFPLASHCWCQLGQVIIGEDEDWCAQFTPVLSYG
jgi:hypothetical protein